MKAVDKNKTGAPRKVPADVKEKQDPDYSSSKFGLDLERVTRRLDDPSERAPKSSKK
jgi:hypothetical protein